MSTATIPAATVAHVRDTYPANFADYLLSGDCWRAERPSGFQGIFDDLVSRGMMRRSRRGNYWWVTAE